MMMEDDPDQAQRQLRMEQHQITTGHLLEVGEIGPLQVGAVPGSALALTNQCFLAPTDFALAASFTEQPMLTIGEFVLAAAPDERIPPGVVALNGVQRGCCQLSQDDSIGACKVVALGPYVSRPCSSITW